MLNELPFFNKIIPEQMDIFVRRYSVLKVVSMFSPLGRRSVALYTGLTERSVRSETEKLSSQKLICIEKTGMYTTHEGEEVLKGLECVVHELLGLTRLEADLQKMLSVKKICIVQGDCDETENVKRDIGRAAAGILMEFVNSDNIIAVTGGSTMECLIQSINMQQSKKAKLVVPARGSVGHKVSQQSDTLASLLASKLKTEYRLLNIPDNMNIKAMNEIKNEPGVQDILQNMQNADILLFGIGNALKMAEKRRVSHTIYDFLERKEAVAEAFGYYFNSKGDIVYTSHSLGIKLTEVSHIPCAIAVAGGVKKASSIIAVSKSISNVILVIDEGAAKGIIDILKQ